MHRILFYFIFYFISLIFVVIYIVYSCVLAAYNIKRISICWNGSSRW